MTSVAYPSSGPTYTYSFYSMSRPSGLTDQNNSSIASGLSYGPANELLNITHLGAIETRTYNNLLQLTGIADGGNVSFNMQYLYPSGTNNGKVTQQSNALSGEQVVRLR